MTYIFVCYYTKERLDNLLKCADELGIGYVKALLTSNDAFNNEAIVIFNCCDQTLTELRNLSL